MIIGVLSLQGDFEAHRQMLRRIEGVEAVLVRSKEELAQVDGLVIPGGESTTIGKLLDRLNLMDLLRNRAKSGMPIFGTCAGMILMASDIEGSDQHRLNLLDVTVARNAFGRQVDSFEANIDFPEIGENPVRGVFIRAPYVSRTGCKVKTLAMYRDRIVAVRENNLLASAFHPELTTDERVHAYFAEMVSQAGKTL